MGWRDSRAAVEEGIGWFMSDNLWDQVIADMRARDEFGTQKYGRPLRSFDGRRTLQDAYEEALDLAVYIKKEIVESAAKDKRITDLVATLAPYRWRPIDQIHEDFGPCVLMHINDPGHLNLGSNLDLDFDESQWTHFAEVPKLTHEEAERLKTERENRE